MTAKDWLLAMLPHPLQEVVVVLDWLRALDFQEILLLMLWGTSEESTLVPLLLPEVAQEWAQENLLQMLVGMT